jgi:predicted phage tail protein
MDEEIIIPEAEEILNAPIDITLQGSDVDLEKTNTYKWSGAEMQQQVGLVIPVVYGRHLMAGNLINAYIEEGENETLNMLVALCEGEIDSVNNVMINRKPIADYYGDNPLDPYGKSAEVSVRTGTPGQIPIEGFGDLHSYSTVDHVLRKNEPYEFQGVVNGAEGFALEFLVDKLYQLDDNQNDLSWYISIRVEYKLRAQQFYQFMGIYEVNRKTQSLFKRYFKSEYLPVGLYDIRVTKVSDNADDYRTFGDVTLASVDEITTENLAYPSTALIGLRLLAIQNLQNRLPNITCVVTGKKVRIPKVTYDDEGTELVDWDDYYYDAALGRFKTFWNDAVLHWDGTYIEAWSGNPVWCLRDLLLNNRYGLGDYIKSYHLNDNSFLQSALYCEEGIDGANSKKEKRFALDIVLDTDWTAETSISMILRSFRGLIDTSSGSVRLTVEKQGDPVYMFTVGNIVKDSFSMNYLTTKISNVISVDYANKDKDWARDSIEVGDEDSIKQGEPIRQSTLQLIGCTSTAQAIREAKIQLNKLKLNKVTISFSAYVDAVLVQPNDVFEFQHEMPAWGEGGRIKSGSTDMVIKLDKEVVIEPNKTYELMIKNGQNDLIETKTVTNFAGLHTELSVSEPFSFTPSDYDLWAFGEVDVSIQQYRALNVRKGYDGKVEIQAIEYNAQVYDPTAIIMPEDNYIHLSLDIPDVTNLILKEKTSRSAQGAIISQIEVSFQTPITTAKWVKQATRFEIYLSDNDGKSWDRVGIVEKGYYLIPDTLKINQLYWVSVVSVTEDGDKNLPSTSPRQNITLQGWTGAPSNVLGFEYEFTDEIVFTWQKNTDEDIAGYEIRYTDIDWGANNDGLLWRGSASRYTHLRPEARSGIPFYIRAFNTAGVYSSSSTVIVPENSAPGATTLKTSDLFQKTFLSWDEVDDLDIQHYEVWRNSQNSWNGEVSGDEQLVAKVKGVSVVAEVPHNPTYFRVRAIDRFSGGAWSNVVTSYRININAGDIGEDVIKARHISVGSILAEHIAVNAIQAEHIAANSITAEKLAVDTLSALSADIGKVIAGEIVGVRIRTSEADYRTELDQTGLYSYNCDGNLVVKLTQGELCLINPTNPCFYSFFDSGQIKYHTPYGDIPSVKRIQSGIAIAGSEVTLCQWYETPHIIVGLKKLTSYDAAFSASCQEWCVYADSVRQYNNGGGDFGWKFDVHAKLALSGGTRPECVYDIPFATTCCTGACTCEILVKENFQVWCNDHAPSNYYYGRVCFEVKYRKTGCGVWCSCAYVYDHPHVDEIDVKTTHRFCQTVNFGDSGTYEVRIDALSTSYINSGVDAKGWSCCLCCYQYQTDCSYYLSCMLYQAINIVHTAGATGQSICGNTMSYYNQMWTDGVAFSFSYPVCRADLYYSMYGNVSVYSSGIGAAGGSICGQYGGGGGGSVNSITNYAQGNLISSVAFTSVASGCAGAILYPVIRYQGGGTVITDYYWRTYTSRTDINVYVSACQEVCYKKCTLCYRWCCYWYKVYLGTPATCDYKRWYSMTEISGQECILDPSGEVTYLAVAYS